MSTTTSLTNELQAAWEKDGFFILPEILSEKECEELKQESLSILQKHAKPGATVHLGCAAVSENFARLAEHPRVLEALGAIMPDGIEFLSDKIVYKKPGKSFATPWHIDAWYWKNTRPKISVWIPFEDTSAENGTLTVVPGSHRRTWGLRQTDGVNGEFSNELENSNTPTAEEILVCELKKGSAVVFSDLVLHGSTPSQGAKERYAIISTYHAPGDEPFDAGFRARKVLMNPPAR